MKASFGLRGKIAALFGSILAISGLALIPVQEASAAPLILVTENWSAPGISPDGSYFNTQHWDAYSGSITIVINVSHVASGDGKVTVGAVDCSTHTLGTTQTVTAGHGASVQVDTGDGCFQLWFQAEMNSDTEATASGTVSYSA
jgi:hypothetical protein